jgi:hypothetical protein
MNKFLTIQLKSAAAIDEAIAPTQTDESEEDGWSAAALRECACGSNPVFRIGAALMDEAHNRQNEERTARRIGNLRKRQAGFARLAVGGAAASAELRGSRAVNMPQLVQYRTLLSAEQQN